jgi:hypothetical protein
MKANIYKLAVLLFAITVIAGCKKDSKDETSANSIQIDGNQYDMSHGIVINYGSDNSVYNMEFALLSPGLTIHDIDGYPDSISGTGHIILFSVMTSGSDKITPGDYTYSNSYNAGTFDYGIYELNWNPVLNTDPDFLEITAGTIKIISSGATYELSFTGTDSNNKAISGYYKGSLKYYTDFKKSAGLVKHRSKYFSE